MNELDILDLVENAIGKQKEAILKKHNKNQRLFELLDAALNFKRKFYIKKFDDMVTGVQSYVPSFHDHFMTLLTDLETREIVGNDAIIRVTNLLRSVGPQQAKWYSRVIRKDLKIGCNLSTAIKAGFEIPKFEVQLAKDGKKCKCIDKILKNGAFSSPKFDGYRCIAIIEDGEAKLLSRNGTVFTNFPSIEKSLVDMWWSEEHNTRYIFDGEIMSDDFNAMQQSAFASKRGTTVGDVSYYIFDMIPITEWESNVFTTNAKARYERLELLFTWSESKIRRLNITNLKLVEHKPVSTMDEIRQIEREYIENGFEGVMLNPDIPYYRGEKSNKMLKFKTMKSMDCVVLGVYEGENGKKFEGTLGGVIVRQENGIECKVGSGFNEIKGSWKERDAIWRNPDVIIGRTIEVKYQEIGSEGRMRFPVIMRFRDDK